MKSIAFSLISLLVLTACIKHTEPYYYVCRIPDNIPQIFSSGDSIYWDCNWNTAYDNGRVKLFFVFHDPSAQKVGSDVFNVLLSLLSDLPHQITVREHVQFDRCISIGTW